MVGGQKRGRDIDENELDDDNMPISKRINGLTISKSNTDNALPLLNTWQMNNGNSSHNSQDSGDFEAQNLRDSTVNPPNANGTREAPCNQGDYAPDMEPINNPYYQINRDLNRLHFEQLQRRNSSKQNRDV